MTTLRTCLGISRDSPTGLIWLRSTGPRAKVGQPALTARLKQYYRGRVLGVNVLAHRAVFALHHGYWPDTVDHIDGNPENNKPENLREVTASENMHNRVARGTVRRSNGWYAQLRLSGRRWQVGPHPTEQLARDTYLALKAKYHPTAPARCYKELE